MNDYDSIASSLEATGDFKVLRRLRPEHCFQHHDDQPTRRAVILDVETTGLNPRGLGGAPADEVIELAMLPIDFTNDFQIVSLGDPFQSFREPKKPISPEIQKLTGITNNMVRGHSINLDEVSERVHGADFIIAHNAKFDRRFAEILHPRAFNTKAWACSWSQIAWPDPGGTRLSALLYRAGLFHEGHRALDDCLALAAILARPVERGGMPALRQLIETAEKPAVRLWALGSPFEKKDALKLRGYRWNAGEDGNPRSWSIDIAEEAEASEIQFLRDEIFGPGWSPKRTPLNAFNRFSDRI